MQHRYFESNRHFRNDSNGVGAQPDPDSRTSRERGWTEESGSERETPRRFDESHRLEQRDWREQGFGGADYERPRSWQDNYSSRMGMAGRYPARGVDDDDDGYGRGSSYQIGGRTVPRSSERPDIDGRYEPRYGMRGGVDEGRGFYDQGRGLDATRWSYEGRSAEQGRFDPRFEQGRSYEAGRFDPRFEQGRFEQGRFEQGRFEPGRFEPGRGLEGERGGQRRMGRGPKGYKRSDDRIKEDVCDRIAALDIDASNVEVDVKDGEVTLTGSVPERGIKYIIEQFSERVMGVQEINNQLRVKPANEPSRGRNGPDTSAQQRTERTERGGDDSPRGSAGEKNKTRQ